MRMSNISVLEQSLSLQQAFVLVTPSCLFLSFFLSPNAQRGSHASTLKVILFAGLSFSVADIGLDVILVLTVPLERCSHKCMVLPMGGVCVIQQDSYYWLIPSSPVIWLAFHPSKKTLHGS